MSRLSRLSRVGFARQRKGAGKASVPSGEETESQRNLYVSTRDTRDTRDNQPGRGSHCPGFVPVPYGARDKSGSRIGGAAGLIVGEVDAIFVQALPVKLDGYKLIQPARQPASGMRRTGLREAVNKRFGKAC